MKQEGLSYFTDTHLTMFAFFIFLSCFLLIFFWTFRKSAKGHYEKLAEIPLKQDQNQWVEESQS